MNIDLKGKRAIVCGSTRGIGRAVAVELASLGAELVLIARNEDELKKLISSLSPGKNHRYVVADFDNPDELKAKTLAHLKEFGPVHILVNNTGGPPGGPITEALPEAFEKTFTNHLICNQILAQAVLEGMKKEKYGRIINIISTSVKQPLKGLGVSNTIRAAVGNWSKTWSNEVAQFGITVNNVLPGATRTDRLVSIIEAKAKKTGLTEKNIEEEMLNEIPMNRFASPEEIANAVAFLASPAAAYITGINIPVDGGRTSSL
jgi:3-oxoacyl-[acyl-carrier protein] reductase